MTTFSTASRARLRHANAGPDPQGSSAEAAEHRGERMRETRRVRDHQGQSLRRESAGNASRPGRRLGPRPLARGRCRARRPTPVACPRFRRPVVARRYAVSSTALTRSVRVTRPTVPTIVLPGKVTVKGAPDGRVSDSRASALTLDCDLARQNHWHLSGWTGQTRGLCGGEDKGDSSC